MPEVQQTHRQSLAVAEKYCEPDDISHHHISSPPKSHELKSFTSSSFAPVIAAMTSTQPTHALSPFELHLSGAAAAEPGVIRIAVVSHHENELRINIDRVRIKTSSDSEFRECNDFEILASHAVDKSFRIDLDPYETRLYGIRVDLTQSFDYEIVGREQNHGWESVLTGHRNGFDPPENFVQLGNEELSAYSVGQTVIVKSRKSTGVHTIYVIAPEDGTPNDFGIFDKNEINPTAAYIDMGRDGYKHLAGHHVSVLEWDRDTVAYPPDDLTAIHIRDPISNEHGWYFRQDLLMQLET